MENPFLGEGKAEITRRLPGEPSETVDDYIADAWAKALSIAPTISEEAFPPEDKPHKAGQVKTVLRSIILRWHESGINQVTGLGAGPYQIQLGQPVRKGYNLLPSEVVDLQRITQRKGQPFTINTVPEDNTPAKTFVNGPHAQSPNGALTEGTPNVPQISLNGPTAPNSATLGW